MLRRSLLQLLASLPFLRHLVAPQEPTEWRFEAMLSTHYQYTIPLARAIVLPSDVDMGRLGSYIPLRGCTITALPQSCM